MKQSFSKNFRVAQRFNLDYVIPFYKSEKGFCQDFNDRNISLLLGK